MSLKLGNKEVGPIAFGLMGMKSNVDVSPKTNIPRVYFSRISAI